MITASYITLAGANYNEPPANPLPARVRAATANGIRSLGVKTSDAPADVYASTPEIEWVDLSDPLDLRPIIRARDMFLATRVNVGVCSTRPEWAELVRRVTMLARLGMTVAIEPVAFGGLSKVSEVLQLVWEVNQPNVGILWDFWQVFQDSPQWLNISAINPRNIVEIQATGAVKATGDVFTASQNRPTIADSPVNVVGWLQRLRDHGVTAPLSYECPHTPTGTSPTVYERAATAAHDMSLVSGLS